MSDSNTEEVNNKSGDSMERSKQIKQQLQELQEQSQQLQQKVNDLVAATAEATSIFLPVPIFSEVKK